MPNTPDPDPAEPSAIDPALVIYLKRLVTILTIVMVAGLLSIVGLLVSRFYIVSPSGPDPLTLPGTIVLPDDSTPLAFTKGPGWYAVVTEDNRLLVFDEQTGELKQTVQIE